MGALAKLKETIRAVVSNLSLSQRQRVDPTRSLWMARQPSGVHVDHDVAMTQSAFWACVKCIAETVGMLNMHVFEQKGGGKVRRDELRVAEMLRRSPNPEMGAMTFKEILTAHALTWGNGYAEIVPDQAGRPAEMWPLLPDRMRPIRLPDGQLAYEYTLLSQGRERIYMPPERVFHLKGFGFDGLQGYDVVAYAARTIGAAIAVETFGASFFGNGTHISGVLQFDKAISAPTQQKIKQEWVNTYRGPYNAHNVAILDEGAKWVPFGISPEASQFLQTRQIAPEEIAKWFRLPLHKIQHLLHATFSNIEHQAIEFVQDTILPWAVRWEQEADEKLIVAPYRSGIYTKMNIATLLRGDMKSRYDAYKIGRDGGWLSANEIRQFEDMSPIGAEGDVYLAPMNYTNAEALTSPAAAKEWNPKPAPALPKPPSTDEPEAPSASALAIGRDFVRDAANRVLRRERNEFRRHWDKAVDREAFTAAMVTATPGHRDYAFDALWPAARAYAVAAHEQDDDEVIEGALRLAVDRYLGRHVALWISRFGGQPVASDAFVQNLVDDVLGELEKLNQET